MTGAALVLSVVDSRTRVAHLVAVETVALHRRSGRYPSLCDIEVLSASMLTEPDRDCRACQAQAQAGASADWQRGPVVRRRSLLSWSRRSRHVRPGDDTDRSRREGRPGR